MHRVRFLGSDFFGFTRDGKHREASSVTALHLRIHEMKPEGETLVQSRAVVLALARRVALGVLQK